MSVFDFHKKYPIAEITLHKHGKESHGMAILDTGSPYTILSKETLSGLQLEENDTITEVYLHGIIHKEECGVLAPAYMVDIEIGGHRVEDVLVVMYDFNPLFGLIGHNILADFKLVVDWKERQIKLVK